MWSSIWNWFKSFFKSNKQDILAIILSNLNSDLLKELNDTDIKAKAFAFVKELHNRTDISGLEKAKIFNEKLLEYAKKVGKIIAPAMLNLLREVAYMALKVALSQGITMLLLADGTRVDLSEEVRAYKKELEEKKYVLTREGGGYEPLPPHDVFDILCSSFQ